LLALNQLVADDLIAGGKVKEGIDLLDETITDGLNKKLYYFSMDLLVDIGDQLLILDKKRALKYYIQGLDIADKNSYLIYSEVFAKKLFEFYSGNNDASKAALYSNQLVSIYQEREAVNTASGIDYIDYVLKQQELSVLQQKSEYQTWLLVLIITICISIVVFLIVLGKNLKRTKNLNRQVINQNSQMKQAINALQESQEENARMMKIIAHDLRNPIAGIWSMTSLLLADENRSPRDAKALNHMVKASDDALTLVSDFLSHNAVTGELKKEPVDFVELIEYCVNMVRDKADNKEQKIILDVIPAVIPASREKLWRVVSNLITNAIKFSSKGQTILIKTEHIGKNILILIEDKGIGIPEYLQEKVFDVFTDSKRKGTGGEEPFGLGLFISKQIVEAHGGKIWFESREGQGTKFFVEVPG
ncbi:MAG: HAMP domain-containing histidine kinase, partial [Sphingobacteriales bacterium]